MLPFRIDFSMNRGHEMLLDRETGISRKELDDIELQMLQSQRIPHVLPMDWLELDGQVTFRFKLDGVKMLRHRLQLQPISMSQFYAILLGIADAIDDCRSYMLKPEGFLLDEPFIFTGEQLHDIRLAYVPMKEVSMNKSTGVSSLLALVVKLIAYVDEPDGEGLKRIFQHTASASWPNAELKTLLLELIDSAEKTREQIHRIPKTEAQHGQLQNDWQSQVLRQQRQASDPVQDELPWQLKHLHTDRNESGSQASGVDPVTSAKESVSDRNSDFGYPHFNLEGDDLDESRYDRSQSRLLRMKWLLASIFLIAVACIWRFGYMASNSTQSLLISAGVTLMLTALLLFLWRKRAEEPDGWGELEEEEEVREGDAGNIDARSYVFTHAKQNTSPTPETSIPAFTAASSVLRAVEPTMLLGNDSIREESPVSSEQIWLKRSWEGKEQRIDLRRGSFRIGRTGEKLDFTDEASNVSRLHLEIESGVDGHSARDVGSRNGSLLNGQTMIAYKAYKLAIGDVIHLAGADGPAYELKSG